MTISSLSLQTRKTPSIDSVSIQTAPVPLTTKTSCSPSLQTAPSSPLFSPPKISDCLEIRFLKTLTQMEELGQRSLEDAYTSLEQNTLPTLTSLSAQKADKIQQAAQRSQESDVWTYLQQVGSCLLSAVNIALGTSILGVGATLLGTALIASGILTLACLALQETKALDWIADKIAKDKEDLKKELLFWIPVVIQGLAMTVGAAGGAFVWQAHHLPVQAALVLQTAFSFYTNAVLIGKETTSARISWLDADLKGIDLKISLEKFRLDVQTAWMKDLMQQYQSLWEKANELIQLSIELKKTRSLS